MPEVIRGARSNSFPVQRTQSATESRPAPSSPTSAVQDRRVTFENSREGISNSLPNGGSFPPRRSDSDRRRSSHHHRDRDLDQEERDAYYDSRAATQREYRRRGSTLQSYYQEHPELLPQLPFTFRHGFKRWKLAGYITLMLFDACIVPIILYYAMTYGGSLQGYITFAVITAIWGGPTYMEFAVRSLRLIKKEHFYKPLGANQKWAFDITNWILVLTIACVTSLLIIGAAPHIVFLRVLSMPAPTILYCIAGPIFLLSLYSARGWKAPFRISSTAKGEKVLPGVYYIIEDIVAVNAGGGRPFREVVCIHPVPSPIAYGLGWAVPFIWAAIWTFITLPWVRSVMAEEKRSWEEDSAIIAEVKQEHGPRANAPGLLAEKASDSSTLHGDGDTPRKSEAEGTAS